MKALLPNTAFQMVAAGLLLAPLSRAAVPRDVDAPLSTQALIEGASSLFDRGYVTELNSSSPEGDWAIVRKPTSPPHDPHGAEEPSDAIVFSTGTIVQSATDRPSSRGPVDGYRYYAWMDADDVSVKIVSPSNKFVQMDASGKGMLIEAGADHGFLDARSPALYTETVSDTEGTAAGAKSQTDRSTRAATCLLETRDAPVFEATHPFMDLTKVPRLAWGGDLTLIWGSRATSARVPPALEKCTQGVPYLEQIDASDLRRFSRDQLAPLLHMVAQGATLPAPTNEVKTGGFSFNDFFKQRRDRMNAAFKSLKKAKPAKGPSF